MSAHQLNALMAPTGGPAWVTDLINGDHFGGGISSHAAVAVSMFGGLLGDGEFLVPAAIASGHPERTDG